MGFDLDTLKEDFTEGLDYGAGLFSRIKDAAPEILGKLQKYATNPVVAPIVAALEEAGSIADPAAERVIVAAATELADLIRAHAAPAAPAAPAATEPPAHTA